MVEYASGTWRSYVWLCFALASFNIVLLVFLFPESTFKRPEPSQAQELQPVAEQKETTSSFIENASAAAPEDSYTTHTPPFKGVLRPFHYNKDASFFKAVISPLKLLVHPSVCWGIFTYGISLSPQIIMMYVLL
jgi:heme exporter protein D